MEKLFNGKFKKAITFSFDDGNIDDIRLIEILNKYGLKGTFNLNSAKLSRCGGWVFDGRKNVKHIDYCESRHLYDGHEIAGHSYTHPHLNEFSGITLYNQIYLDKKILEFLFECRVYGMAYPNGTYNQEVIDAIKECGLTYARTIKSTFNFELPQDPYTWHPTCHFRYEKIEELADEFLSSNPNSPQLFYIWGHSYELVTEDDWQHFENFCKKISGKNDIYYCTNTEALI